MANTACGTTVTERRDPIAKFDFRIIKLLPENFLDVDFRVCADTWLTHAAWNNVFAGMPEELSLL